jgi:hypothetical protein
MQVGDVVWDVRYEPDYPRQLAIVVGELDLGDRGYRWDVYVDGRFDHRYPCELEEVKRWK